LFFCIVLLGHSLSAQWTINGSIISEEGTAIAQAEIFFPDFNKTILSDGYGAFHFKINDSIDHIKFTIGHIAYQRRDFFVVQTNRIQDVEFVLVSREILLEKIEVSETTDNAQERAQNQIKLNAKSVLVMPSAFGDFSKVLSTLPGVAANNELSSTYSVRGGNFQENLVYVNGIQVYRPFLANTGRQEGLSFINPDFVQDISFYAGGWQPKYGDKLSSSLNIEYKEPDRFESSASVGLLGGKIYLGGSSDNQRSKFSIGLRHKDARYLLNTLEVSGQYFPKYTDVQGFFTFDLTKKSSALINKTKLNWLLSYGQNRYQTIPISQSTVFGSVAQNFRLQTDFIGKESLHYDTYQTGFNLSHRLNDRFKTSLIASTVSTQEKENFEVEGAYRLCDVDQKSQVDFNDKCIVTRAIGTNFDYGRNSLSVQISTIENRNEWLINSNNLIEFGVGMSHQNIADDINEYGFIDSADYVTTTQYIQNELSMSSNNYFGYLQYSFFDYDSSHIFNIGSRFNYMNWTDQFLLSPRVQYQYRPSWSLPTRINFSVGFYHQHPQYREFRNREGEINKDVSAQKSLQLITGIDRFLTLWGRPFIFTTQAYYKYLWDLNPYEIDNVRIRYYADNIAIGYATGLDVRINGEFIAGTQSWFSLGLLKTMEDIENDENGYQRRPSDQRITIGAFFEDHLPNDPSLRVYLNLNFGSGYPFGPPNNSAYRNAFSGDEYYRVDLGLTKIIPISNLNFLKNIILRLEVLNILEADNTISYHWIEDVNGNNLAIPNSLSARYFNLKIMCNL
jgi:hypothetical protein